ncbi:MAG: ribosomal-processing cysteine protease Prp [Lachnospiraceae bacterium]|nr:ribosomal-processing cysteine protease Prp [Lachnospiraceae bacterium]
MIKITIYQNQNNEYVGIESSGHAGFARHGKDIVCSAVSVLVINTINGIEQYTEDAFSLETKENDSNFIKFHFTDEPSNDSKLLMNVMVLGLTEIQKQYGKTYITLNYKEV